MACTNCGRSICQSQDLENSFELVVVKRTAKGYGFEVQLKDNLVINSNSDKNNKPDSFVVKYIKENTGNTKLGLKTGDEILSFNGTSIRQLTMSHIEETLKNNKNDMQLIIRRRSPPKNQPGIQSDDGYHGYDNRGFNTGTGQWKITL
ncbi:uncharacterized protein LOC105436601 [Strongylocentrotus purpuratus]|uniref:PDZ domain-containing protein n=1 Tax=Strongylocentrotus purpuratus TaxID=7668 RepID=A0A7M7HBM4_STRPU|nr:uncharacterized protein LOC105436601 [Strongylocentrotus purpuratus]